MTETTRFAPSPTGHLHLGHAYSALFAHRRAGAGGRFLVRIEDIDAGRVRPAFGDMIFEDLAWLGLDWERPVLRQSEHMDRYSTALRRLEDAGLLYPCFCTRAEIRREIEAAGGAPHGPDGPLYPGTCRGLGKAERAERIAAGEAYALRLDMQAATSRTGDLQWRDRRRGIVRAAPTVFGDVVLARKDTPTSYHLSCTVDDARQEVTLVTRGEDLFESTHVHRLLQALLGLPTPDYEHHRLLTDAGGRRLAKRDKSLTLESLRASGRTPAEVRAMLEPEAA